MFKDVIGHKKQKELLKRILDSGQIPHAMLFVGPDKMGKKKLAQSFINSIFGEKFLNHPDFIMVEPVKDSIQIQQIRQLGSRMALKPVKAPVIGLIIDDAHLMTTEAQNSFLKSLEEPHSQALVILIAKDQNFLLPTIISRCETIKFGMQSKDEIIAYLKEKKVSQTVSQDILSSCQNRIGLAIDMLSDRTILSQRKAFIKEVGSVAKASLAERFKYAEEVSKREDIGDILPLWIYYFREQLFKTKDKLKLIKLKKILNSIQETIFLVSATNVNVRLTLEAMMLEI